MRYAAKIGTSHKAMRSVAAVTSLVLAWGPARCEASEEAMCMRVISPSARLRRRGYRGCQRRRESGSPPHLAQFFLPFAGASGRDVGFDPRM